MIRARRARIVATLEPASREPEMVLALARAGADVFRLNFSHGSHEDHAATLLAMIRAAERSRSTRPIGALADLQGPKFRLGEFKAGAIEIEPGDRMRFDGSTRLRATPSGCPCPIRSCSTPCPPARACCWTTARCGCACSKPATTTPMSRWCRGPRLSDHKGVVLPARGNRRPPPLTPKDRDDLAYALRLGVDWVALSFSCNGRPTPGRSCAAWCRAAPRCWPRSKSPRRPLD